MEKYDKSDIIIVNFTTWTMRDKVVPEMLAHFKKQTLQPDKIICWLSESEYDGKIPKSIKLSLEKGFLTDVRFVEGNTYGHKRYETFKENINAYNIFIDDDIYYPEDYVESLYKSCKIYPNDVSCYYSRHEIYKHNGCRLTKEMLTKPSFENRYFSGLAAFPPGIFPIESFNYTVYRDRYCKKCDDSWVNAWLMSKNIKVIGLHNWGKTSPLHVIDNTQKNGIYETHNGVSINGIKQISINIANAMTFLNQEKLAHKIWPEFNIEEVTMCKEKIDKNDDIKEGVSICITAYNAQNYIEECLNSVENQIWFKNHNNWEIIVGVDHCDKTLEKLKSIMCKYKNLKVLMMDSNMGTYVTSNTIMSNAEYSYLLRFDSDDIMLPNMIDTLMNNKEDYSFVRFRMENSDTKASKIAWGQMFITKKIFIKYGGFRDWRCSADSELYYRLINVEKIKNLSTVLMKRRIHNDSLTQSKETGMKSQFRKKYIDIIKNMNVTTVEDATIKCITNTYEVIFDSTNKIIDNQVYSTPNIISSSGKNPQKSKLQQLRDDIQNGRVIRIITPKGFIWKRVNE